MLTQELFASAEDQATINDSSEDRVKEANKGTVKVKAKPSIEAIKARAKKPTTTVKDILAATEPAPF
jgi:hypothetical protein